MAVGVAVGVSVGASVEDVHPVVHVISSVLEGQELVHTSAEGAASLHKLLPLLSQFITQSAPGLVSTKSRQALFPLHRTRT
jgi:hypothetical protein